MADDLSTIHGPVSDLFPQPVTNEEWARYRLTNEQIEFYHEHGYLAGIRILDERQTEVLRAELAELLDPHHPARELFYEYSANESLEPGSTLFHALGAWRITPGFHDLLWNPAFVVPAAQLLDAPVRFWHDQIFYKPAHHGGIVAWHQDYSYWTRTEPMAHLSCWIGLDDANRENGCLHYVPGSHRWNLLPITGLANTMDAVQSVLSDDQKRHFKPVPIELECGQGSFHHPLMIHGSFENKTDRPRRATVVNVFAEGVKSASNKPPLDGVPPIPIGMKMAGQFFPLLFDESVHT